MGHCSKCCTCQQRHDSRTCFGTVPMCHALNVISSAKAFCTHARQTCLIPGSCLQIEVRPTHAIQSQQNAPRMGCQRTSSELTLLLTCVLFPNSFPAIVSSKLSKESPQILHSGSRRRCRNVRIAYFHIVFNMFDRTECTTHETLTFYTLSLILALLP